jgi:hypothetical protein
MSLGIVGKYLSVSGLDDGIMLRACLNLGLMMAMLFVLPAVWAFGQYVVKMVSYRNYC